MTTARIAIPEVIIRPVGINDREAWDPLWKGYLDFYEKTVPQETTEFTWKRLTTAHEPEGLLAVDDKGLALGLVQFFYHPSTNSIGGNCYLQALFVTPSARGRRVGRRLIAAVVLAAKARKSRSPTGRQRSSMAQLAGSMNELLNVHRSFDIRSISNRRGRRWPST